MTNEYIKCLSEINADVEDGALKANAYKEQKAKVRSGMCVHLF